MRGNDNQYGEQSGGTVDLLADSRRRHLLYCLYLYTNPVKLSDITYQVTIWGDDEDTDDIARERHRVYMSLYHDHLPELVEAGVVEYDQEEDAVELGSRQDEIKDSLERHLSEEIDTLLAAEQDAMGGELPATVPDNVYQALAAQERRKLLSFLLDEPEITLNEATTMLVSWKATQDEGIDSEECERIRGALHHVHLPVLEEAGLVSYDRDTQAIELAEMADSVRDVVQSAIRSQRMTRSEESNPLE